MAAVGILAALHERERSGEGQMVDISMTDGALSWLAMVAARYFAEQKVPQRGEPELAGGIACYFPYETKDGKWVSLGALEPKFWQNWCNGVGRPDLIEKQFEHPDSEAGAEIAAVFRERTRDEWTAFAGEHDCCLEPILDLDEVLDSRAGAGARDGRRAGPAGHRAGEAGRRADQAVAHAAPTPPAPRRRSGADTDDVLREIGIDPQPLREEGVV